MSECEKKWVIKKKKLLAERVVENWDMCTKKILYNIFTTLSQQVLSFRLLWVFIGGSKKLF